MLKRALMLMVMVGMSGLAVAQNPKLTIFAGYSYGNTNYAPGPRSNLNRIVGMHQQNFHESTELRTRLV